MTTLASTAASQFATTAEQYAYWQTNLARHQTIAVDNFTTTVQWVLDHITGPDAMFEPAGALQVLCDTYDEQTGGVR